MSYVEKRTEGSVIHCELYKSRFIIIIIIIVYRRPYEPFYWHLLYFVKKTMGASKLTHVNRLVQFQYSFQVPTV